MKYEELQQAASGWTKTNFFKDERTEGFAKSCFIEGALWRERVWHIPEECPARGADFIYQKGQTLCHAAIIASEGQWQDILDYYNVKRWAYTADLLPTEETTNGNQRTNNERNDQ